jgi:nuclear transport factor 2 (NTF2) superfamily protein
VKGLRILAVAAATLPPTRPCSSHWVPRDADRVRGHMRKGLEAWNARDADRMLALVTEDILWEDPSIPGVGRAAGRQPASA